MKKVKSEQAPAYKAAKLEELMPWDEDNAVVEKALAILRKRVRNERTVIGNPEDVKNLLTLNYSEKEEEVFGCIFLTATHAVIAIEDLFSGTVDSATVYARVVVKKALRHNAAAVILYHNHPSGDPKPSPADERLTITLKSSLGLLDIKVLDHFVVGSADKRVVSFAELGLI